MGQTYPNEIQRILYKPGGDVGKYARKLALQVADEARRLAEVELGHHPGDKPRTGRLARGYKVTVLPGTNTFRIKNSQRYADVIELGASPHEIHARRVQYLQFTDRFGRRRTVKMVRHPGNKAYRHLQRSAEKVMQRTLGSFRRT